MVHPKMYTIRRLNLGEARLYRQVRLEALKESPEAFATRYESALRRDDDSWIAQADASAQGSDRATFIAVLSDEPIGLVALYRDAKNPSTGDLIQMWVSPFHRDGELAADLLNHLLDWTYLHSFRTIRAEVTPGNLQAFRFYEKHGFRSITAQDDWLLAKVIASP